MTFNDICGQTKIKTLLENSIKSGRIMNSYIIEGDTGMGKKTIAEAFGAYLMCETKSACGACHGCMLYKAKNHPDIITVKKDESKKTLDVEAIRSQVMEFSYIKPYTGDRKVIIIPEYGGIGVAAQNALLKIIEEPPPYLTFIILVRSADSLLDTVKSRSIILTLENYTSADVMKALDIHSEFEINRLMCYGDGNIGKIKQLANDEAYKELRQKTFSYVPYLFSKKHSDIFKLVDFIEENKASAENILDMISGFFRDIYLIKTGNRDLIVNTDYTENLFKADYITTFKNCFDAINIVQRAKADLRRNVNFSLCITAAANDCWEVLK